MANYRFVPNTYACFRRHNQKTALRMLRFAWFHIESDNDAASILSAAIHAVASELR